MNLGMKQTAEEIYSALMGITEIENVPNNELLGKIGLLIDVSGDLGRKQGLDKATEWASLFEAREVTEADKAVLEYFQANVWATRWKIRSISPEDAWAWEQPERQQQIFCLRRAVTHAGFAELPIFRRCQIYTNLANQLNSIGRFVDALEYWGRALNDNPKFGMAHGNVGYCLLTYAKALSDRGHQALFLKFAHDHLSFAISTQAQYEGTGYSDAKQFFKERKLEIESIADVKKISKTMSLTDHPMGDNDEEISYRQWCLENRLFLNPLNDLGEYPIANQDVFLLPPLTVEAGHPPTLIGFFNQLKQEFISARWFLYDGTHTKGVHFADKGVLLYNTLDYPSYSISVEKTKVAFRIAYSIFDKIAFFLNDYLALNLKPPKISFRKIWYENAEKDRNKWVIRDIFERSENWPLRGLFWLSKDLFEEEFVNITEPDAQAVKEIRNHLEHKYLKAHDVLASQTDDPKSKPNWSEDQLAYSITRTDLEAKALRLFKLSRAALTYLSLGVRREELRRQQGKNNQIPQMMLDLWNDEWKR
jgi:hypothetical protein